jgi:hypothetical protein
MAKTSLRARRRRAAAVTEVVQRGEINKDGGKPMVTRARAMDRPSDGPRGPERVRRRTARTWGRAETVRQRLVNGSTRTWMTQAGMSHEGPTEKPTESPTGTWMPGPKEAFGRRRTSMKTLRWARAVMVVLVATDVKTHDATEFKEVVKCLVLTTHIDGGEGGIMNGLMTNITHISAAATPSMEPCRPGQPSTIDGRRTSAALPR